MVVDSFTRFRKAVEESAYTERYGFAEEGPTSSDLERASNELGILFPEDYQRFLMEFHGQVPDSVDDSLPLCFGCYFTTPTALLDTHHFLKGLGLDKGKNGAYSEKATENNDMLREPIFYSESWLPIAVANDQYVFLANNDSVKNYCIFQVDGEGFYHSKIIAISMDELLDKISTFIELGQDVGRADFGD